MFARGLPSVSAQANAPKRSSSIFPRISRASSESVVRQGDSRRIMTAAEHGNGQHDSARVSMGQHGPAGVSMEHGHVAIEPFSYATLKLLYGTFA